MPKDKNKTGEYPDNGWATHHLMPFVVLVCLLIVISILAWWLHFDRKEWVGSTSAALTFSGLLFVVRQLRLNEIIALNNHDWNRKKATFDFVKEYYSTIGLDVDKLKKQNESGDNYKVVWNEKNVDNHDYLCTWRKVLNYFEHLCCGIKHQLYDNEIAYDHVRGAMLAMWKESQPYVTKAREKNPLVFQNLEDISRKWEDTFRARNHQAAQRGPLDTHRNH